MKRVHINAVGVLFLFFQTCYDTNNVKGKHKKVQLPATLTTHTKITEWTNNQSITKKGYMDAGYCTTKDRQKRGGSERQ